MKSDVFPAKKPGSSNEPLPLETDWLQISLCQADLGRLLGITRQRVSQMVSRGQISTLSNGRINPSIAAAELLRQDAPQARSKILVAIRQQIERTECECSQALARAAPAEQRATRAELYLQNLALLLIQSERRLHHLETALEGRISDDDICEVMDFAFTQAGAEPPLTALDELDEDTRSEIIAALSAPTATESEPPALEASAT